MSNYKFLGIKEWKIPFITNNKILVKNIGVLGIARMFTKAVAFIFSAWIGRNLGVKDFGLYSLGMTWAVIIFSIVEFGLEIIIRREVARDKTITQKYLSNALGIRLLSSILALAIAYIITTIIGYSLETKLVILSISLITAVDYVTLLFFAVIEAHESMELEAVVILIRGVLLLMFTPIIFALGGNLWWFILLLLIIAISKFLQSNYFMITRFVRPRLAFDMKFWGALIIEAYPLAFISIFAILYFRIDSVMLSIYSNEEAVGIYNAAYSFMAGTSAISSAFFASVFPRFSKAVNDKVALRKLFYNSLGIMFIFGLLAAVVTTVGATQIITLFFGDAFVGQSDKALRILAWAIFFLSLSSTCGIFLNATNHQKATMYITGLVAIVNVVLNLILIPQWSFIGAAIVTVISYFVGFTTMFIYIRAKII